MFALPKWVTDIKKLFGTADGKVLGRAEGAWTFVATHSHDNATTLDKIGEAGGEPTWDDGPWPGGSGGGHTILNGGIEMPQRSNLTFVGLSVSDNEVGDETVVEVVGAPYAIYLYRTTTGGL